MKRRKTIKIEVLKTKINKLLLDSADDVKNERIFAGNFLSEILIDTGNYQGYRYLSKIDINLSHHGISVGINDDSTFKNTDESRVRYF